MIVARADTHTALWHLFDDPRFSPVARAFIEEASRSRSKLAVSSISIVEVVYLVEKGRLATAAYTDLVEAVSSPRQVLAGVHFTNAMAESMKSVSRSLGPDMPDRMIAANAVCLNIPIISRDGRILSANLKTIW